MSLLYCVITDRGQWDSENLRSWRGCYWLLVYDSTFLCISLLYDTSACDCPMSKYIVNIYSQFYSLTVRQSALETDVLIRTIWLSTPQKISDGLVGGKRNRITQSYWGYRKDQMSSWLLLDWNTFIKFVCWRLLKPDRPKSRHTLSCMIFFLY